MFRGYPGSHGYDSVTPSQIFENGRVGNPQLLLPCDEPYNQDVKLLGAAFIIVSVLHLLAATVSVFVYGSRGLFPTNLWNLWQPGSAEYVVLLFVALMGIVDGIGLLFNRIWAQNLGVVLSMLNLIVFPLGTAIGIFGLWQLVLRNRRGAVKRQ